MRTRPLAFAALAALLSGLAISPALAAGPGATSVTMCHRTRSVTNPYRSITVSQSSVTGNNGAGGGNGGSNGHGGHTGPVFSTTPGYYSTHTKDWGDVIPPFGNYNGLNWAGALPSGSSCRAMSAAEFYNVQREAGVPRDAVIADLQEQGALGDPGTTELSALVYTGSNTTLANEDLVATGGSPTPEPTPSPTPTPEPSPTPAPQPSPSPTAPPTSPATPAPSLPPAVGTQRITGLVWLDRNRDGVQDRAGEPGPPAVTVDLYRVELDGSGGGAGQPGMALRSAAPVLVAQVTTAQDGSFVFSSVVAGA